MTPASPVFIMAIRVVEFSSGGAKLERFLHKNQRTQRELLNFEFWTNGELSKIGHHFINKIIEKIILGKSDAWSMSRLSKQPSVLY